jgi:hypothetical protein
VAGTDEGDDDIPEEAVLHAIRWGVRGWHAGRGPGQEPREAPGEFKALLAARMAAAERVLEDLERLGARKFPREDAPSGPRLRVGAAGAFSSGAAPES